MSFAANRAGRRYIRPSRARAPAPLQQHVVGVMAGIAFVAAEIDRPAHPHRQVGIDLDQAAVIALIPIVARPAPAGDELEREALARRAAGCGRRCGAGIRRSPRASPASSRSGGMTKRSGRPRPGRRAARCRAPAARSGRGSDRNRTSGRSLPRRRKGPRASSAKLSRSPRSMRSRVAAARSWALRKARGDAPGLPAPPASPATRGRQRRGGDGELGDGARIGPRRRAPLGRAVISIDIALVALADLEHQSGHNRAPPRRASSRGGGGWAAAASGRSRKRQ